MLAEKQEIGFKTGPGVISHDEAKELVLSEVKKYFKPEFINRLDDMIVFHSLSKVHMAHILEILLNQLVQRLGEKSISLHIEPEVKEKLVSCGYDPRYGARPLKRTIEREIENRLSLCIVNNEFQAGDHINALVEDGEIAFRKSLTV